MSRYTLTINFDDTHDEPPEAAALHASLIAIETEGRGFKVESSEFTDHQASFDGRWWGGTDWAEWCERDEAQDERMYA